MLDTQIGCLKCQPLSIHTSTTYHLAPWLRHTPAYIHAKWCTYKNTRTLNGWFLTMVTNHASKGEPERQPTSRETHRSARQLSSRGIIKRAAQHSTAAAWCCHHREPASTCGDKEPARAAAEETKTSKAQHRRRLRTAEKPQLYAQRTLCQNAALHPAKQRPCCWCAHVPTVS